MYFLYGITIAFSGLWNLKSSVTNKLNDQTSQSAVELEREYSFFISQPSKIIPWPQHYAYITQNSHNRTEYGWEWDWTDGLGSYTEGTYYGETIDYIFSGTYK